MRLGIDFGTTRIVIAAVDRGNYPLVSFETGDGEMEAWYPSLVALRGGEIRFGWNAMAWLSEEGVTAVSSLKPHLQEAGPHTLVEIGDDHLIMIDLLTGMCRDLKQALTGSSSLNVDEGERFEVMLGVPANANGNQRFLTVEAFRQAGFEVIGLLNEPSAASLEYGHLNRPKDTPKKRDRIVVYDLGGGTFDASTVEMDDNRYEVTASEGIPTLGGQDFDIVLAEMALEAALISEEERQGLTQAEWFRLIEECRHKKEHLYPTTRRIHIELDQVREDWPPVTLSAPDFYERVQPLVQETLHCVADLLKGQEESIEAVYVAGGASELPIVGRLLREHYGRRVRRSSQPRSATAVGLAIQADLQAGYVLRERFTRNFGVWREAECGTRMIFDPLFLKGTPLPTADEPPLRVERRYHAPHNIGHFRYLECSHTDEDGRPAGEITLWDEIQFPFDAAISAHRSLEGIHVVRRDGVPWDEIEEAYDCEAGGTVKVEISNRSAGYSRSYQLGRWSVSSAPVKPGSKKVRRPKVKSAKL